MLALAGACAHAPPSPPSPEPPAISFEPPSASFSVLGGPSASSSGSPPPQAEAPPEDAPSPREEEPQLDCSLFPKAPAPSRRTLCEMASAKDVDAILDARGFAQVSEYDSPSDDVDPAEGHSRKRVCGELARKSILQLYETILFKLRMGGEDDPWFFCKGMTCELRGEGEWSTWGTLHFRKAKGRKGIALEAWTEIELALIEPAEAARRKRSIQRGIRELASASCPAP